MAILTQAVPGTEELYLGNEAIARGALEAGVNVVAGYPGTPSSEIIGKLAEVAGERNIYVEWSANEKVAMEVAAAASFAGLRSMCVMKQNGVNVTSDFLLHLSLSGIRGGMIVVPCEDPGALSGTNEGETRHFARMLEIPLLEPGGFQDAKEMTKWAFELSEELGTVVMVRSVTRISHGSGNVGIGELPQYVPKARFRHSGAFTDPLEGPMVTWPVNAKHLSQQQRLERAAEMFEDSPFNHYRGPDDAELLIVTSSACNLYSREAVDLLGVEERVGILKLGTTFPLPARLLERHLARADNVLVVEEVLPFLEESVKVLAAELAPRIGTIAFHGKRDGTLPAAGELNPDLVIGAVAALLDVGYRPVPEEYVEKARRLAADDAPARTVTFCPGCPHRASFWSIHNALVMDGRDGFVCGDIGCYSLAMLPCGFEVLRTVHAMGSGTGLASGFGKLGVFGLDQPVVSVCGDSTFFHAAMPALVNAVHHGSDILMIVLDNEGTGMTGFQPHPGLPVDATGAAATSIDIPAVCRAIGARVEVCDPFEVEETRDTLLRLLDDGHGVRVLVLRQICALSPEKKGKRLYQMAIDGALCLGRGCGCNRLCTRIFQCPSLFWDDGAGVTRIDEVTCSGCGVCASICPSGAISRTGAG